MFKKKDMKQFNFLQILWQAKNKKNKKEFLPEIQGKQFQRVVPSFSVVMVLGTQWRNAQLQIILFLRVPPNSCPKEFPTNNLRIIVKLNLSKAHLLLRVLKEMNSQNMKRNWKTIYSTPQSPRIQHFHWIPPPTPKIFTSQVT